MKELSIEEKAKAYDEAIKRAKEEYDKADGITKESLKKVFPQELKYADDEGVRKHLISLFEKFITLGVAHECESADIKVDDILAWLEKQGDIVKNNMLLPFKEYDNLMDSINKKKKEGYEAGYKQGLVDSKGEQKSTDKVEPKFKVGDIVKHKDNPYLTYILKKFTDDGDYEFHAIGKDGNEGCTHFAAVKCQDDWELVEQKPAEWSEDDETRFKSCIKVLQTSNGYDTINVKWLKSLKDRVQPQPQQQWSEEDEDMCYKTTAVINRLCADGKEYVWSISTLEKLFYWLKSIRPQSTWRPSATDIMVLEGVIDGGVNPVNYHATLHVVLDQLKKLRGE